MKTHVCLDRLTINPFPLFVSLFWPLHYTLLSRTSFYKLIPRDSRAQRSTVLHQPDRRQYESHDYTSLPSLRHTPHFTVYGALDCLLLRHYPHIRFWRVHIYVGIRSLVLVRLDAFCIFPGGIPMSVYEDDGPSGVPQSRSTSTAKTMKLLVRCLHT